VHACRPTYDQREGGARRMTFLILPIAIVVVLVLLLVLALFLSDRRR
jgi:hypothetical protein